MTSDEVRRLEQRIESLEGKFMDHVKEHRVMERQITEIVAGVTVLKYVLGAPLVVGMLLLVAERVLG